MNEMKMMLPILKKLGINPDKLSGDKISKILNMAKGIRNPSDVSPEMAREFANILNIKPQGAVLPKKSTRVKPNAMCPCGSGKKYKKCCRLKSIKST